MKKVLFVVMAALLSSAFSQVPTVIDTVTVPVGMIRYAGGSGGTAQYSATAMYQLDCGSRDSLNVALTLVPSGGAEFTPTSVIGDVGKIQYLSGIKYIYFTFNVTGTPASYYQAKVTIIADTGYADKVANAIILTGGSGGAALTSTQLVTQTCGTSTTAVGATANLTGLSFTLYGKTYTSLPGITMTDGPNGVRIGGNNTDFPTGAAMANTWDTATAFLVGMGKGKETQARGWYCILGPMTNTVRDPRDGRAFETYSEDPFLAGKILSGDVKGCQSVHTIATAKHFVCNDREQDRGSGGTAYSSNVNQRTLREIYAMPWEIAVKEANLWSVMSSYNKVNTIYASENPNDLTNILKSSLYGIPGDTGDGFRGFEMSDWGGTHSTVAAALAGHDMEMSGSTYFGSSLASAVSAGQVPLANLQDKVRRTIRARIWSHVIDSGINPDHYSVGSPDIDTICANAGRKCIVLAKNDSNWLPLSKTDTLAVVGSQTGFRNGGSGSSAVTPPVSVSPLQGIQNKIGSGRVLTGSSAYTDARAKAVIVCVGVTGEGENADRSSLDLPTADNTLVSNVLATGKKTIVVFTGGSAAAGGSWSTAAAVIIAFYPGEFQGEALADVIFGDYNPAGRLGVTFPASDAQWATSPFWPTLSGSTPAIQYESPDTGCGYRWYDRNNQTPLFCFGHGLSYTTFNYSNLTVSPAAPLYVGDRIIVSVDITNTGSRLGEEVSQLYITDVTNSTNHVRPLKELRAFSRDSITAGAKKTVSYILNKRQFAWYDSTRANDRWVVTPGNFTIQVGASSQDIRLTKTITLNAVN